MVDLVKGAQNQRLREYETIFIMRSNVTSEDSEKVWGRVEDVIKSLDGTLLKVDNWGRRKLAYPVEGETRGVFVYFQYIGYNNLVAEIERNFGMLDAVTRYQTIKLNDTADPAAHQVDPEDLQYAHVEAEDDEVDPTFAERLGMGAPKQEAAPAEEAAEAAADESAETQEENTDADSAEEAATEENEVES